MSNKSNTSTRKKSIKIICINNGLIEIKKTDGSIDERTGMACPIELYETYTTPGPVISEDGDLCYPLNEFGGKEMLAQRFVVYKDRPNKHCS